MPLRRILIISLFFLSVFSAFAQKPDAAADAAAKEKRAREVKLLEQILADTKNLRLPENRALVFARVGSSLWPSDEKFARRLFQEAIAEVINAQTEAQAEKTNKQYFQTLTFGQQPRVEIIGLIGNRDAALALEYLIKSRPAAISEAMQNPRDDSSSPVQQYARAEIGVEQRLVGQVAEQNPELALKKVRETLKKGVSYETLNLLKKIYTKDPQTADKLAEELFESFFSVDFTKNHQTAEAVGYFINDFGQPLNKDEKAVRVPEEMLRRLILKMTGVWLAANTKQIYGYWNCRAVIERLVPDLAAQVKKKIEKINGQYQNEESLEYSKLLSSETPPEELVARAEKFQASYRNEIYRSAAAKYAGNGNIAEAERILQSGISGEQTEYYLTQFYTTLSYQLAGQGKFEEANNYINQIPDETQRINPLISLAGAVYQKNPKENQKWAENILSQARALISETPESHLEISALGQLAVAFAPHNPDESFRLMESVLPRINELFQANFVMMKYRNYGGLRQNEFQITNNGNNLQLYNFEQTLRLLKEKDFDRTLQFANGIARTDMRIWFQLQLLEENSQIYDLQISSRMLLGKRSFE